MASAAQVLANRINFTLSTGPKSFTGKTAASRSAVKHGLSTPNFFLLPDEDPEEFQQLVAGLNEKYQPGCEVEYSLIAQLSTSQWKLMRARRLEADAMDKLFASADENLSPGEVLLQAMDEPGNILDKLRGHAAAVERSFYETDEVIQAFELRGRQLMAEVRERRKAREQNEAKPYEPQQSPAKNVSSHTIERPEVTTCPATLDKIG